MHRALRASLFLITLMLGLPIQSARDENRSKHTEQQDENKKESKSFSWLIAGLAVAAGIVGNGMLPERNEIQLGAAGLLTYCATRFHAQKDSGTAPGMFVCAIGAGVFAIIFGLKQGIKSVCGI